MPIIKSAVKRMHQTVKRRARNQNTKRAMRSALKDFSAAIAAKDSKKATTVFVELQSNIDTAVKKNVLKKNTAARTISRLHAQLKSLGAKPVTAKKTVSKPGSTVAKKPTVKKPVAKKTVAKKPVVKKTAPKK